MFDNPLSLEDLCLECICDKLEDIFEFYFEPSDNSSFDTTEQNSVQKKFRFKDSDLFVFNELSERLLHKLGERNLLCDSTLNLFNEKNTRLRTVKIKNTHKITYGGLKILKQHKIVDLECVNLKNICINKIIGQLFVFQRFNSIVHCFSPT